MVFASFTEGSGMYILGPGTYQERGYMAWACGLKNRRAHENEQLNLVLCRWTEGKLQPRTTVLIV